MDKIICRKVKYFILEMMWRGVKLNIRIRPRIYIEQPMRLTTAEKNHGRCSWILYGNDTEKQNGQHPWESHC